MFESYLHVKEATRSATASSVYTSHQRFCQEANVFDIFCHFKKAVRSANGPDEGSRWLPATKMA
jgi:hypothetical protein